MEEKKYQGIIIFLLSLLCSGLGLYAFSLLDKVIIPLVLSILMYFAFRPIIGVMYKIKIPRFFIPLLVVLVFFFFALFVGILAVTSSRSILEKYPEYIQKMSFLIRQIQDDWPQLKEVLTMNTGREYFELSALEFRTFIPAITQFSLGSMNFFSSLFMVALFLFFLTMESFGMKGKLESSFGKSDVLKFENALKDINYNVSKYLSVKLLMSLLTAIVIYISFFILKVNFSFIWALLVFLFNWIPAIGSILISLIIILFAILQFYPTDNFTLIIVCIMTVLPQILIGNILDPKLLADSLKLSSITILVSLLLWSIVWGIPGMFLAVPLTVVIKTILLGVPSVSKYAAML